MADLAAVVQELKVLRAEQEATTRAISDSGPSDLERTKGSKILKGEKAVTVDAGEEIKEVDFSGIAKTAAGLLLGIPAAIFASAEWLKIRGGLETGFGKVADIFRGIVNVGAVVYRTINPIFQGVSKFLGRFGRIGATLTKFIRPFAVFMKTLGKLVGGKLLAPIFMTFDFLKGFFGSIQDGNGFMKSAFEGFVSMWKGFVDPIIELGKMLDDFLFGGFFQGIGDKVISFFEPYEEKFMQIAETAFNFMMYPVNAIKNATETFMGSMAQGNNIFIAGLDTLKGAWMGVVNGIVGLGANINEFFGGFFVNTYNTIVQTITNAIDNLKRGFGFMMDGAVEWFTSTLDWAGEGWNDLKDTVTSLIDRITGGITRAVDFVAQKVEGLTDRFTTSDLEQRIADENREALDAANERVNAAKRARRAAWRGSRAEREEAQAAVEEAERNRREIRELTRRRVEQEKRGQEITSLNNSASGQLTNTPSSQLNPQSNNVTIIQDRSSSANISSSQNNSVQVTGDLSAHDVMFAH